MNSQSKPAHILSYWLLAVFALIAVALADVAAVAIPAMAISLTQFLAGATAFMLIAAGVLYTVWRFE